MRIPNEPYVVSKWWKDHPGEEIPDQMIFTQPWDAGPKDARADQVIYYQYRTGRARRSLRGIDEQVPRRRKPLLARLR